MESSCCQNFTNKWNLMNCLKFLCKYFSRILPRFPKHRFFRTWVTMSFSECAKVRILVKLIQQVLIRWNYLFFGKWNFKLNLEYKPLSLVMGTNNIFRKIYNKVVWEKKERFYRQQSSHEMLEKRFLWLFLYYPYITIGKIWNQQI